MGVQGEGKPELMGLLGLFLWQAQGCDGQNTSSLEDKPPDRVPAENTNAAITCGRQSRQTHPLSHSSSHSSYL